VHPQRRHSILLFGGYGPPQPQSSSGEAGAQPLQQGAAGTPAYDFLNDLVILHTDT
jgi:hypothetical protein